MAVEATSKSQSSTNTTSSASVPAPVKTALQNAATAVKDSKDYNKAGQTTASQNPPSQTSAPQTNAAAAATAGTQNTTPPAVQAQASQTPANAQTQDDKRKDIVTDVLQRYSNYVKQDGPLQHLSFTKEFDQLPQTEKNRIMRDIAKTSGVQSPDEAKSLIEQKATSQQLLSMFQLDDNYWQQSRLTGDPKKDNTTVSQFQQRQQFTDELRGQISNDPSSLTIKDALKGRENDPRYKDWLGCYQVFSTDMRTSGSGIPSKLTRQAGIVVDFALNGPAYSNQDTGHMLDSDKMKGKTTGDYWERTAALYENFGQRDNAKDIFKGMLSVSYFAATQSLAAKIGIPETSQQFQQKKQELSCSLQKAGLDPKLATDSAVKIECYRDTLRQDVSSEKRGQYEQMVQKHRDEIMQNIEKNNPALAQQPERLELVTNKAIQDNVNAMVNAEADSRFYKSLDQEMPAVMEGRSGFEKKIWNYYKDAYDPLNEFFNMSNENKEMVIKEAAVNGAMLAVSGGTANIVSAGLSAGAKTVIGRFAVQSARAGLAVNTLTNEVVATGISGNALLAAGKVGLFGVRSVAMTEANMMIQMPFIGVNNAMENIGNQLMFNTVTCGLMSGLGYANNVLSSGASKLVSGATGKAAVNTGVKAFSVASEAAAIAGVEAVRSGAPKNWDEFSNLYGKALLSSISLRAGRAATNRVAEDLKAVYTAPDIAKMRQDMMKAIGSVPSVTVSRPNTTEATQQTMRYAHIGYIPADKQLADGFKDGGMKSIVGSNGSVTSNREVIVVDRSRDPVLRETIKTAIEKFGAQPDQQKAQSLVRYVRDLMNCDEKTTKAFTDQRINQEVLLGDFIQNGVGVCRHANTLYKVLADAVNLPTEMWKGNDRGGPVPRHAYNFSQINGEIHLVDPGQNRILAPGQYAQPPSDFAPYLQHNENGYESGW
ncbi:MAG: EDR1-related protein [Candidatus Margulisiibacteriota bacterium]